MATYYGSPKITTDGLTLCLDAGNVKSYPGSGTTWSDLSGNGNHFTINASAYNSSSVVKYMDFNGSYGIAKRGSDTSLDDTNGVTYIIATRIKNSTGEWRTLTRAWGGDHQVIIESGGWNIGMYDNDVSGFLSTGFSQQSLPNYGTSNWIIMYWRWQPISPYYSFSYNDTPGTIRGSLTSTSNARYTRGIGSLGGWGNGDSANVNNSSQYWGDIAYFATYARYLSNSELSSNYNALKGRFGLT